MVRAFPGTIRAFPGTNGQTGLSAAEAARRLATSGENRLSEAPPRSPLAVLLVQFKSVFILVLAAAAIIAGSEGRS